MSESVVDFRQDVADVHLKPPFPEKLSRILTFAMRHPATIGKLGAF
jgi:hypothetical protein